MSTGPAVSVLVPVYNYVQYVGAAIQSAREQTFGDLEIVVVDNQSTDGSWELLQELAAEDERIRLYRNDVNIGGWPNLDRCYELGRAPLVKYLMADDLLAPTCVERMVDALKRWDEAVLAFSHFATAGADGIQTMSRHVLEDDGLVDTHSLVQHSVAHADNLVGSPTTVMFRRAALPHLRPFQRICGRPFGVFACTDWALWLELLAAGPAVYVADDLSLYRHHGSNGGETVTGDGTMAVDHVAALAYAAAVGHRLDRR